MLIHVQKIKDKKACKDHFQLKVYSTLEDEETFPLCKRNLCSCIQMLQKNEFCTILSNSKYSINIRNVQGNQFVAEFCTPIENHILCCLPDQNITPELQSSTLPVLLKYLHTHWAHSKWQACLLFAHTHPSSCVWGSQTYLFQLHSTAQAALASNKC